MPSEELDLIAEFTNRNGGTSKLSIDRRGRLYIDDERIVTEQRIRLSGMQTFFATGASIATVVIAATIVYRTFCLGL